MRRILLLICLMCAIGPAPSQAKQKHVVVFEATVVRLDNWGLMKFSCGVAIHFRLAEYQVEAVQRGRLTAGQHITVRHLACNWNELDELKLGDRVLVEAEGLKRPEKEFWKPRIDNRISTETRNQAPEGVQEMPLRSEAASVKYQATKVAKLIYPTSKN